MDILVEPRFKGDAVRRLAHQRPAHAGEFRVHASDRAPLARQRVVELEDLSFDFHLWVARDIHIVFRADPGEALGDVREYSVASGLGVDAVHAVLVANEIHRILDRQHWCTCRIEYFDPAGRFEEITEFQSLPREAELCAP